MTFRFLPFIALVVGFIGLAFVYTGLHSIDNAWNLRYINTEFNLNLNDSTTLGRVISAVDVYNMGVMQVMGGVFMLVIGLISFAYYEPRRNKHGA